MTLSVLEGHSPIASLFDAIFRICSALRATAVSAELLVALARACSACAENRHKWGLYSEQVRRPTMLSDGGL